MGQCYSVYLKLRVKDEQGAVKAVQERLVGKGESLEELARQTGLNYDTLDGILRHYYASWDNHFQWDRTTDPDVLSSSFDASYSWESVMMEVFELMAPYLRDGSSLKIYPDYSYDLLKVKDGKAVQLH